MYIKFQELEFFEGIKKDAVDLACQNLIRNSIVSNNPNVTYIMDTSSVLKSLTFDKILINTFRRCLKRIDFQVANDILNTDSVTFYNSSLNYAIEIFPEEYNFTSNPSFDEQEKTILEMFYGVNFFKNFCENYF